MPRAKRPTPEEEATMPTFDTPITGDPVYPPDSTQEEISATMKAKASAEGRHHGKVYAILHGAVGPWWQGQTITDEHLAAIPGVSTKRLLDLGAIAEVDSEAHIQAKQDGLAEKTPVGDSVTDEVPIPEPPAPPKPS